MVLSWFLTALMGETWALAMSSSSSESCMIFRGAIVDLDGHCVARWEQLALSRRREIN